MKTDDDFIHLPELYLKFGDLKKYLDDLYNLKIYTMNHDYRKLTDSNVWGLDAGNIAVIEEEGFFDGGGHWVFNHVGTDYEAVYDGIYMHVFGSLEDLMARENEIAYYEYSPELSEENGEETFVNAEGKVREYKNGGGIKNENREMLMNNNKQIKHHTTELSSAIKKSKHIPAWVVSKMGRSTSDISDITHYLDGQAAKGKIVRDLDKEEDDEFAGAVPIQHVPSIKSTTLYFQEGTSNKEYHIQLRELMPGRYIVNFQYGRRGGPLQSGTKTTTPVSLQEAEMIFEKLKHEKERKGYHEGMAGGGKISDLDSTTQSLINEIIDYLEKEFGGKVTASRMTGSMKNYIMFKKRGGSFYDFNEQWTKNPKYNKILQDKFGYGVFMDNSRINIELLGNVRKDQFASIKIAADGRGIPNNYKGKNTHQVWDAWNQKQRHHFLFDHEEDIVSRLEERNDKSITVEEVIELQSKSYMNLPEAVKDIIAVHIVGGQYDNGGGVGNENAQMVLNNNKQISHHAKELSEVLRKNKNVPAWVVAKVHRAASDLSDATHYLDGSKAADGKEVGKEYKLRAEGINDFINFLGTGVYFDIKWFKVEITSGPDVIITFSTNLSLKQIKENLEQVQDSHVMLDTVKSVNQYTGERMANGGGVDYTDYKSLLAEERRLYAEYNKVKADYDREYKEDEFDSLLAQEYKQKMEMLEGKMMEVNNDLLYLQTHGIEKSFGGERMANGGGVGDEKKVLRYRNKLVQMNVGKNEPSLDFAIKIIDMLVDGELIVKYANGGGIKESDDFRGKINNDIKYVFVSDTYDSYLGDIPKIELFKDWESAKKSYIKYLKTSNNYWGNWTMALYECNGDCSIYSQSNVKKVKNAKQLHRFYGHHGYVEGKIVDSVKVDDKKFIVNLIEGEEFNNGGGVGAKWTYEIKVFNDPKYYGHGRTWDTREEAELAGKEKLNNWMNAEDYRVVEVSEKAERGKVIPGKVGYFVKLEQDTPNQVRYLQIGINTDGSFTGMVFDYVGGGTYDTFWILKNEIIEGEEDEDGDIMGPDEQEEFVKNALAKKYGKDFSDKVMTDINKMFAEWFTYEDNGTVTTSLSDFDTYGIDQSYASFPRVNVGNTMFNNGGMAKGGKKIAAKSRNEKVYSALLEEAKEEKAWAEKISKDKEWMSSASNVSKDMVAEALDKSAEELANISYNYLEYRAHMTDKTGYHTDKPAKEKWEMLGGKKIASDGTAVGRKRASYSLESQIRTVRSVAKKHSKRKGVSYLVIQNKKDEDGIGMTPKSYFENDKELQDNYNVIAEYDSQGNLVRKADNGMFMEGEFDKIVADLKKYLSTVPYIWTKGHKQYVPIEGWQYAAALMGMNSRVTDIKPITEKQGWMATAEVVNQEGIVVCTGFGYVDRSEAKWSKASEYELISFAQTRAVSRALRNCISYLIKAAGYSTTPAEEMYGLSDVKKSSTTLSKASPIRPIIGVDDTDGYSRPEYIEPIQPPIVKVEKKEPAKFEVMLTEVWAEAKGTNIVLVSPKFMTEVEESLMTGLSELSYETMLREILDWLIDNNIILRSKPFMKKIKQSFTENK